MYPQAELTLLDRRKQALLMRITVRRNVCVAQTRALAHPFRWIGTVRRVWNAASPLAKIAAVPVGLVLARKLSPWLGRLLRWTPAALRVYRVFCR